MITVRDEIAKNLRFYRKKNGLTQKALAEKLDLKSSSISNWETGVNSIDIDTLHLVCVILSISINDMFGVLANQSLTQTTEILSSNQQQLLNNFDQLNTEGQERLLETSEDMLELERYKKCDIVTMGKKQA